MEMQASKPQLRAEILARLREFSGVSRRQATAEILAKLSASWYYKEARSVGLFYPLAAELDLRPLLSDLTKKIYLPKVLPQRQMAFLPYDGWAAKLLRSDWGLMEPAGAL